MNKPPLYDIFIVLGWAVLLTLTNLIIIFEGLLLPIPKDISIILMLTLTNFLSGFIIANVKKTVIYSVASFALMLIITYQILILPSLVGIIPSELSELLVLTSIANIRKGLFIIFISAFIVSLAGSLYGEHKSKR